MLADWCPYSKTVLHVKLASRAWRQRSYFRHVLRFSPWALSHLAYVANRGFITSEGNTHVSVSWKEERENTQGHRTDTGEPSFVLPFRAGSHQDPIRDLILILLMLCLQGEHDTLACVFVVKNDNISQTAKENPTCPWSVILGEETTTCLDKLSPPNRNSLSTLLPSGIVLLHVTHLKCVWIPSTLKCVGELCFQLDGFKPEFLHFQNTRHGFSIFLSPESRIGQLPSKWGQIFAAKVNKFPPKWSWLILGPGEEREVGRAKEKPLTLDCIILQLWLKLQSKLQISDNLRGQIICALITCML